MDYYFTYRGDIRAAVGIESAVLFVTVHPEGRPTAIYRYVPEDDEVTEQALPCGGVAICADSAGLYVAGTDQRVYTAIGKKAPKPLTDTFSSALTAVASVSQDRLAVVSGKQLHLVSKTDGKTLQSFDLPEAGTCIGTDKTGAWLAVGCEKGYVAVFDGQDKAEFEPADSDRIHDGAVTAILFEPEELRFFSTGTDHKLLSTHARGKLEPEDKGRANNHTDAVTALLHLPVGDRLITGSRDRTVKNWPRAGAIKPATLTDKVGKVVALAFVTQYDEPRVAVCCEDNTIRLLPISEEDGRFDDDLLDEIDTAHGAAAWVEEELQATWDSKRREKAIDHLAKWNDAASLERIAAQLSADTDQAVRLFAAKKLALSENPRAVTLLEPFVAFNDDKVRVEAFKGLQSRLGPTDYRPIDAGLKTGKSDVGVMAVKALEPLAKTDDQGLARLTAALDATTADVRKQALTSLEGVFPSDSPRASLVALTSSHGGVRGLALIRLFERKMLDRPEVLSAVRRMLEDTDPWVRKVAFLLSVEARPQLATILRTRDEDLHRQLNELEKSDKKPPDSPEKGNDQLKDADYDTLLQATAGRALDTCLRGVKALAVLRDPRAFPLLLQLSREEQEYARVEVCRALAALGDDRAVNRLRSLLVDPQPSVRDAAYTAVARLYASTPLSAADAGLGAAHDDVRQRGLNTLLDATRKAKPKSNADPAWGLFVRALNDPTPAVRREAFKAVLNQGIGGGGESTLRFALQSIHADVRREVLTEVQAQIGEEWATPLLYEFFNDTDSGVRKETFEFAVKKQKELTPLESALKSRYSDTRLLAIDGLFKKHTMAAQAVILTTLTDSAPEVRRAAIGALIEDHAKDALTKALAAEQSDVRVQAASALAKFGDPAALPVLRELAFAPEPDDKLRVPQWKALAADALVGLTHLGDTSVFPGLVELIDSPHPELRHLSAVALAYCSPPNELTTLRTALGHADPTVRIHAANALALKWDVTVHPLLMTPEAETLLGPAGQLTAVAVLGMPGATRLSAFLDLADDGIRHRTLLLHLLFELASGDGHPELLLQALSAKAPRTRLIAAQGLEAFHDATAFHDFVVKVVNDRGDDSAWKITSTVVDELAAVLAFADPVIRARANAVMVHFGAKEQLTWNQVWGVFTKRFANEVAAAKAQLKPAKSKLSQAELRELAFGAYVGLAREQGDTNTPAIGKVRQTALSRILAIAQADKHYIRAAQPVFAQALSDPNQPVRMQAFEHLQTIGVSQAILGAESLEAGYTDLGVKGLELLTDGTSSTDGEAVLERVLLTRTDELATEAAKLLMKSRKTVPVATLALDAVYEPLRIQAVDWLAGDYDDSAEAQKSLRSAVTSRYRRVREHAAYALATKKDSAAFDTLAALLKDPDATAQQIPLASALCELGDLRAVNVLLDRIENDPTGTAAVSELFEAAGSFRDPASADRLLLLTNARAEWGQPAYSALYKVSGFDQTLPDADEEPAFTQAEKEAKPLRPDVLAKLLDLQIRRGEVADDLDLIDHARISRGHDVDPALAILATNPDEDVRNAAVQAIGWRAKKRGGPIEPLLKALKHKDPETQFLAAEGLARAGRIDGIQVLLSSIEYLDDVGMRQRAVLALGELSDPRAVDVLLKLANDNGHALQEAAAEAIGHLRKSPRAEEIGRTLERLSQSPNSGVMQRALVGLRWFNSPTGWQIIRAKAKGANWKTRQIACEQLGYDTEPATKELLLEVIRTDSDNDVTGAALDSALRLLGADSLEPFYAALMNARFADDQLGNQQLNPIEKVTEKGDPLRMLELFPKCSADIQQKLEASLTTRREIPAAEATAALAHADDATVRLAARLLSKVAKPSSESKKAVAEAVGRWWKQWQERRAKYDRRLIELEELEKAGQCLRVLFWTANQFGSLGDEVNEVVAARANDPLAKAVRLDALRTIASVEKPTSATVATLEKLATDTDADVRTLAASLLAKFDPKRSAGLLTGYLTDKPTFARVMGSGVKPEAVVKDAAAHTHQQSVALQPLVAAKDVRTLTTVAKDRKAAEPARLGAIEGLGFMADETAEKILVEIGSADGDDEDVRKAAWRALRRSKRRRKRQNVSADSTT
ncbi:MAG: HEAT repeat domain-containing protein [Fimbriiglobus sp.]|nr:HEAT repeat domain-containing protein [Fimbriiglobus sp.]